MFIFIYIDRNELATGSRGYIVKNHRKKNIEKKNNNKIDDSSKKEGIVIMTQSRITSYRSSERNILNAEIMLQ